MMLSDGDATALQELSTSGKNAGITFGGKGHGKLKQNTIDSLQAYYGLAVCAHIDNLRATKNAVLATFNHAASTDENSQHGRCMVGPAS